MARALVGVSSSIMAKKSAFRHSSRLTGRGRLAGGDFHAKHPLVGSWAGDRIAFVGGYAEAGDIPGCDASVIYEQCNAACAAKPPEKPPTGWQEWTNLSAQVCEMMVAEFKSLTLSDWLFTRID